MKLLRLLWIITLLAFSGGLFAQPSLEGAWRSDEGVIIFAGNYFSFAAFTPSEFKYTYGGLWKMQNDQVAFSFEFHTQDPTKVGSEKTAVVEAAKNSLKIDGTEFSRMDNGKPGNG